MAVPLSLPKTCLGCYDECEIRTATVIPLEAFEMLSRYCTFKRRCQRLLPAAPSEVEPKSVASRGQMCRNPIPSQSRARPRVNNFNNKTLFCCPSAFSCLSRNVNKIKFHSKTFGSCSDLKASGTWNIRTHLWML